MTDVHFKTGTKGKLKALLSIINQEKTNANEALRRNNTDGFDNAMSNIAIAVSRAGKLRA